MVGVCSFELLVMRFSRGFCGIDGLRVNVYMTAITNKHEETRLVIVEYE